MINENNKVPMSLVTNIKEALHNLDMTEKDGLKDIRRKKKNANEDFRPKDERLKD